MENPPWGEEQTRAEGVVGIAPELLGEALDSVVIKIGRVASIAEIASKVRERLVSSSTIRRVTHTGEKCFLSIDSSYTSPPLELVGGYLGLIFVVSALYGKECHYTSSEFEVAAYVTYDPTRDLTRVEARRLEREKAIEALRRKSRGEVYFDIIVLDGEVLPRLSPRVLAGVSVESDKARKLVRLTDTMVLLAEKTKTPVVGVLKRSYSKDALAVLGHFLDVDLSDRAFMTYVLEPGEFAVIGDYKSIASAYQSLINDYGVAYPREVSPAKYRLAWLKQMLRYSNIASRMKMAFYRPHSGISTTAVKIEYDSVDLSDEELVSSVMSVSEATGFPAPVDYADALSQIPSDVRFTLYQLVLQRISEANPDVAQKLFTLVNPQKLASIGLRT
ncbi:MAG: DNA double-strand break repair nuclease NurA [Sulfolobales archaeon]